ncbi:MAG: hypothetical protein AAGC93_21420 [Cyanobacteria bacterium P01_F01_bin.53]
MAHKSHLRLTPAEVKIHWEKGNYTPRGYLHHLILAHRKPGWSWRIENVSQFCREWEIPRSTFYKAKAVLVADGVITERIVGSVELTVVSTNECTQPETGVSDPGQSVSDPGQSVSDPGQSVSDPGQSVSDPGQSRLETVDTKEVCAPTSLNNSFTTTYTSSVGQESVGGGEFEHGEDRTTLHDQNKGYLNEASHPEKDDFIPPILQQTKKFGVNVDDLQLKRAIEQWPDRVPVAIACLEEKQLTVKHPTRYLTRAIQDGWQPEKGVQRVGWSEWWEEAHRRGLVLASQGKGDTIMVMTIDDHWVPYEHLRRQSWAELEAQLKPITVESQAAPEELTDAQTRILEAMAILVED